jgi:hypothetical protein
MYMSVVSDEYGLLSGATSRVKEAVDHTRKVEELKRITADTPSTTTTIENKKKEVRRVFYS